MSCLGPRYLPFPPRFWSRVENPCVFDTSLNTREVFVPQLNNLIVSSGEYQEYFKPMINKANILQYKANSATLTKQQRYSKIAKGQWINRTKTWATQSQTYTNPNTNSLRRINTNAASVPIINTSSYIDPFGCSNATFQDGGTLIGTQTVNPCTKEIIKRTRVNNCNLSTDCDVPGAPVILCWNERLNTWYPRNRYTMSNSGNKFPVNYKVLQSANAITPSNVGGVGSY